MRFKKIYVELSDICGLKCEFCPSKKAQRGILSLQNFEKIASQIYDKAELFALHLLGDPLILSDLRSYINLAKAYKMKLEITTSGFYLNEENQNLLLEFENIHQINISLASFFSQKKLDLNAYLKPILKLCERHFERKNSSFINLRLWNFNADFKAPKENEAIYQILRQNFKEEFDFKAPKIRLQRHIILHQARRFTWPSLDASFISKKGFCYALKEQVGILSNGTLVPCCLDTSGAIALGNVLGNSFQNLLETKKFLTLKQGFERGERLENLCQRCEFFKAKA
ncbi:radical SAM/SPASM domain-containing protein [Campylobacter upsaliensis]|uniref:radical SAM/SPASM domain-containing protein n=1 Tax=Campylobacter upsaliensis TaxID=28080 RepID=UPI0022EB2FE4|nr:radical SAM/SPASM domain-containing protein [Campylobacter upsaliensis]MEB2788863.1 SPASM domain-containing protein [Campylobacter upsaliensis]MEB2797932.1 SPASM domain-containing protein [Campylobacter upsaliensis]HEC1539818.1 SPASM domain-containing protein [Campylobacter upsaliensis]